jgi:putative flippase GtrA
MERGVRSAGRRFRIFAGVSALSVITGQAMLFGLHSVAGADAVVSNLISTITNTALVFVANRRWVWPTQSSVSIRREAVPFAAMAAAGLLVSTLFVWFVSKRVGDGVWVNIANLAAFGAVWLVRFAVLERVVYRSA